MTPWAAANGTKKVVNIFILLAHITCTRVFMYACVRAYDSSSLRIFLLYSLARAHRPCARKRSRPDEKPIRKQRKGEHVKMKLSRRAIGSNFSHVSRVKSVLLLTLRFRRMRFLRSVLRSLFKIIMNLVRRCVTWQTASWKSRAIKRRYSFVLQT
jgi:hypothetical protein